jgi:hypothetical protein
MSIYEKKHSVAVMVGCFVASVLPAWAVVPSQSTRTLMNNNPGLQATTSSTCAPGIVAFTMASRSPLAGHAIFLRGAAAWASTGGAAFFASGATGGEAGDDAGEAPSQVHGENFPSSPQT